MASRHPWPGASDLLVIAWLLVPTTAQRFAKAQLNVSHVYDSPLPAFFFLEGPSEGSLPRAWGSAQPLEQELQEMDDSCGEDLFDGLQPELRDHILPHSLQNRWDAQALPDSVHTIELDSPEFRVTLVPRWGGKVHSIEHRPTSTPLVFENRAHMPMNGGVRKAWCSGGIEWNWGGGRGQIGHSVFTEEPAFVAKVPDSMGEHVRVYEFDRFNGTIWQVDILVPNVTSAPASRAVWVHVRVSNPHAEAVHGYWWTNTARHTSPGGRVVSPATTVAEYGPCSLSCAPWPHYNDDCGAMGPDGYSLNRSRGVVFDHSVVGNLIDGRDGFLRAYHTAAIPHQGLYVAHVDNNIYGTAVGSFHGTFGTSPVPGFGTAPNGTKFFAWPNTPIGEFWQDWLSNTVDGSGAGNYIELQIGVAPTQMQRFKLPAVSSVEWTEYIMSMAGADAEVLRGSSYELAQAEVTRWLDSSNGMPSEEVRSMALHMEQTASVELEVDDILAAGMPWGALEEMRRGGQRLSSTAPFSFEGWEQRPEVRPWVELLRLGHFSDATLALPYPPSFMVDASWAAVLRESEARHGPTWLHSLLLGVAAAEAAGEAKQPDLAASRRLFATSLHLKPNPIAARCLAVCAATPAEAWAAFQQAWRLAAGAGAQLLAPLADEIASFLLQQPRAEAWDAALEAFLRALPAEALGADVVLLARATAALRRGDAAEVRRAVRASRFPSFSDGPRAELASLWMAAAYVDEQRRLGRPLSSLDRKRVRGREGPSVPGHVDLFGSVRGALAAFQQQGPGAGSWGQRAQGLRMADLRE